MVILGLQEGDRAAVQLEGHPRGSWTWIHLIRCDASTQRGVSPGESVRCPLTERAQAPPG